MFPTGWLTVVVVAPAFSPVVDWTPADQCQQVSKPRDERLTGEAAEYIALLFITETTAIENCRGAPYKTVIFILLISERDHHKQKRNLQETLESELLGRLNDLKLCFLCYIHRKISDKTRANRPPADIGRALVETVWQM